MARRPADRCLICRSLTNEQAIELDLLMGDATRWPRTLWKDSGFDPPKGILPAGYRLWGQTKVASNWLHEHGLEVGQQAIENHAKHVPMIAADPADLVSLGIIEAGGPTLPALDDPVDPAAYLRYYARGVELGLLGLDLLEAKVRKLMDEEKEIPMDLLKMLVEAGSKLATSQASIKARGVELHRDEDDDAFRRATSTSRSPRIGGLRIREVDGQEVVVADGGRSDREHFAERMAQEGGTRLS